MSDMSEKRDLLGEDRNKVTGEERLKVTISMPLWMKVRIWKESKEKGIPVWEYLAQLMRDSEILRKEGQGSYIERLEKRIKELEVLEQRIKEFEKLGQKIKEFEMEKLTLENEIANWKEAYRKKERAVELLKNIIKDIKKECGACAIVVLESYKNRGTIETSAFIASLLLELDTEK